MDGKCEIGCDIDEHCPTMLPVCVADEHRCVDCCTALDCESRELACNQDLCECFDCCIDSEDRGLFCNDCECHKPGPEVGDACMTHEDCDVGMLCFGALPSVGTAGTCHFVCTLESLC